MSSQEKVRIFNYTLAIILLCLGLFYTTRAHASTSPFDIECVIFEGDEDYVNPKWDIKYKCREHGYWMRTYYFKAEKMTWYLPNYDDKEKGKACFATAIALAMPPNNIPKIIGVAIGLFTKYGLDCIDSFAEVNHYLHRAGYHAEMYQFFCDIMPEDNDEEPDEEW
jgi:hypothetical protein